MEEKKFEGKTKVTVAIDTIHCADCALNIERSVEHLPGVLSAEVSYVLSSATVYFDPHRVEEDRIKRAITKPGYAVIETLTERTRSFWRERRSLVFTALCGILLVFSWILGWFGIGGRGLPDGLAVVGLALGGFPIFKSAFKALLIPDLNVDTLVSIAAVSAAAVGAFQEAATVVFIMLLGESLEELTVGKTRSAIASLISLAPKTAWVRRDGQEAQVPIEEVQIGEVVIVKPGERIPVDGSILSGSGAINESTLTGESIPAERGTGDRIFCGTYNESGSFEMEATQVAEDTKLAHIRRLIVEAQAEKSPIQRVMDRFSRYFIPIILGLALVTFALTGQATRAITVLIVACPCALVLGTPTAVVAAIGQAARRGILIKGGAYLEQMGRLRTLFLDKTGTLTEGRPRLVRIVPFSDRKEDDVLYWAAVAEKRSEHPLGKVVVQTAKERGIGVPHPDGFENLRGKGVRARWNGHSVAVGGEEMISAEGADPGPVRSLLAESEGQGYTVLLVAVDGHLFGAILLSDVLRENARAAVDLIRREGVSEIWMLTGDNENVARRMAGELGIRYEARLLPEDKVLRVREWRRQGRLVAMVGDGVNDGPALAAADVGIAMGAAGTDVAIETADIALMNDDLGRISEVIRLSRRALRVIKENLGFALIFNSLMVFLSAEGWVTMILGAVMHQASSLLVILNSMRLLRGPRQK
jgi:Zn2+/Cd2+-exporting ATPase